MSYSLLVNLEPCDLNVDGFCDVEDIDELSELVRGKEYVERFDVDANFILNDTDRRIWVEDLMGTFFGDANLDGEFNSGDLIAVFLAGEYEDELEMNSTWATGDWDGDGDVTSGDLIVALVSGSYEQGPRSDTAAVPEPTSLRLAVCCIVLLSVLRRGGFVVRRSSPRLGLVAR
jgi:hypothetical protein